MSVDEQSAEWYSVKGWFRWYFKDDLRTDRYEERVVLFKATSPDQALDLAEQEGRAYCAPDGQANFGIEAAGIWHAYRIGEGPAPGVEVFSRTERSDLSRDEFRDRFVQSSQD